MIVRNDSNRVKTPQLDQVEQFEAAFQEVSRSAFLLARQLGKGTDEALDIVQEAALRGWRHRATRRGEFRPWFLAIVYRLGCSRVPNWLPIPSGWDRPALSPAGSSIDPELLDALHELPSRQRVALWLRYVDDLAIADVAKVMRCSQTAAKQLLLRGRDALRRKLLSRPMEEVK